MVSTRFMQRAVDCSICHSTITIQGVINCCTHAFCLDCVLKWSEIENTCPICKRRFSTVTTRWTRKCLREGSSGAPKQYAIREKTQNAHTSMVYEAGQYTIRVFFPAGGEMQIAGLFRYFEILLRGMRGEGGQAGR